MTKYENKIPDFLHFRNLNKGEMTEQIQCICKPKCKCAANPNYAWANKMQSRRNELTKLREQRREMESQKRDKEFIYNVLHSIESAISREEAEIELFHWSVYPDMVQKLRKEYFIGLKQVGDTSRYKFAFLL